jgi:uncharacterized protein (TIGR02145 family)
MSGYAICFLHNAKIKKNKMQPKKVLLFILTSFCTWGNGPQTHTISDIDENVYKTITLGNQVWMAENLRTTKYSNGDSIGTTSPATLDITSENTPKYQWVYERSEKDVTIYGRLYTWYTVTDKRNICPAGWHVPSDAEWTTLTDYLINNNYGYKSRKNEISKSLAYTSGWTTNSIDGSVGNDQVRNNSSGFKAIATGYRYGSGLFNGFGSFSYWWTATAVYSTNAWYRSISDERNNVYRDNSSKQNGISVRCIKDN